MGLRVVEATKACRILRTRGETGLFLRLAVFFDVAVFFLAVVAWCGAFFAPD
jgi:hypothetical protein